MWQYQSDIPGEDYQNQCVRLLLQRLGAIVFNYDLQTDTMLFNMARDDMELRRIENFRKTLNTELKNMVHPDFMEPLIAFFSGQNTERDRFLLDMGKRPVGKYSWYKFVIERETDEQGHLAKVKGALWNTDILRVKANKTVSRFRSDLDSVTGVANELGLAKEVDAYLAGEGKQDVNALVFMRIERYEALEKRMGKRGMETMLVGLCKAIGSKFRSGDVLAHLGSGAFAVFVRDVTNKDFLEMNVKGLKDIFRTGSAGYGKFGITSKLAVAYYPEHGTRCRKLLDAARKMAGDA